MDERRELLGQALERKSRTPVEVYSMEPAARCASSESWTAEVRVGNDFRRIVLWCIADASDGPLRMRRQINGLRLAERAGVPAPRMLVSSDEIELGQPYLVIDHVPGTALVRRILRDPDFADARRNFAHECGEILGRIHRAAWAADGWERTDPIGRAEELRRQCAAADSVLDRALVWLMRNCPSGLDAHTPVHGDFRLGNLMMGASGITAVPDWEACHLGDPDEDLGWLCCRAWRQGAGRAVAGLGTLDELLETYEITAGRKVDRVRLRWWRVYAATLWGLVCNRQRPGRTGAWMRELKRLL